MVTVEIVVRLFLRHEKKRVELHFPFSSEVVHSLEFVVFVEHCFEETLVFFPFYFSLVTQPNWFLQILLFVFNYIFSHFFSTGFLSSLVNFFLFLGIVTFYRYSFTGIFLYRNFLGDLLGDLKVNGESNEF